MLSPNERTGFRAGAIVQFHLHFDDLFPNSFSTPVPGRVEPPSTFNAMETHDIQCVPVRWHATSVDRHEDDGRFQFKLIRGRTKGTTTMRRILPMLLLLLPVAAYAQPASIKVEQVWSRAAIAGHEGVAYMTITNAGPNDALTAASTPVAASADLHQTINDNGIMKMRPVQSLPIDTGKTVTLAPQGFHIMLTGLKQALKEGDSFPITLTFQKAGKITATAKIEKAGATSATTSGMSGHMNMPMPGSKP